ncbi:MAG: HNH endonuclease [Bacteroides sp.]|nr:HNH endonuclease [Bacteroides sp.]
MLFKDYSTELTSLHIRKGAPHKPLLMLTIMDGVETGEIRSEKIYLTEELIRNFKVNGREWAHREKLLIHYPFYHMRTERFWRLVTKPGREIRMSENHSPMSLKGLCDGLDYAEMDRELFLAFSDSEQREKLRFLITETYFPFALSAEKPVTSYVEEIKKDILTCTARQYRDKVKELEKKKDPKIYRVERYARNKQFEEVVKEKYDYTCCISGLRIYLGNKTSLVDACHIIPFRHADSSDTIGNGLALSPTLHRAFDKGLITIDEEYKVVISEWFEENKNGLNGLKQLAGKKIKLPEDSQHYPSQES